MYGILEFNNGSYTLQSFSNVKTMDAFARLIVNRAIKQDNDGDIEQYLVGWLDCINECRDGEGEPYVMADVPTQASDNLVYSNAHYYNGRNPLRSDETRELCNKVESLLENLIKTLSL